VTAMPIVVRGGPSELHEARVEMLGTLATLCGYEDGPDVLPDGTRPDVLRVRQQDRSLFIGDAKATETAGNRETFERLSHYALALGEWTRRGHDGVLALAVETEAAWEWVRTLRALVSSCSVSSASTRVDFLDEHTAVVSHHAAGDG
jgi:hypothetical protein